MSKREVEARRQKSTVGRRTAQAVGRRNAMNTKLRMILSMMSLLFVATVFAKPMHITPSMIPTAIEDQLKHSKIYEHGQVMAQYEGGTVTLSGTVDSLGVKQDAERAVRKMADVLQVVNNIGVRTDDFTDAQIVEQAGIEIATYYAYGIFDNINLLSQGNKLVVSGEVTQPYKKADIGNFLAHLKGVAALDNRLEVLPNSLYDDRLRLAVARAIYGDTYFVNYANQAVPPLHIIVKNGNVTLEGVVVSGVDRAKAEADARFASTYFNLTNNLRVEGRKAA